MTYPKVQRLQVFPNKIKADILIREKYSSQVVFTNSGAEHLDPTENVDIDEIRRQAQELMSQEELLK